ncbi:GNAT family N-acetyltransferase [Actinophytocola oryzae]|uniref:Acetyltransferase (GNAT) family protein n=1 Tax=Actinophytocola oryzae TaxID=502181 RepID=A0A4R7VZM2_9PSEU|nr:GNAT family N-acetyltransferase [Actinophytocola oryzae]TDV55235.1 acetyltransferase (GNAT) family protein [Actinophytocola oryzae]
MSRAIAVRAVDAFGLATYARRLERLYRLCFSTPPWLESEERLLGFHDRFERHLANPGVSGVVVSDGDAVVGVVYGWPSGAELASGSPFDDALAAAATPDIVRRLVAPAVTVAELMVDPGHQRRGIGRALLTRYVDEFPAAWLATHPDAPAATMYRQEGWRQEFEFAVDLYPLVVFTWQASTRTGSAARRAARG